MPDIYFIARTTPCGGYKAITQNYRAAMESAGINYTLFCSDLIRKQYLHELFSINTTRPTIVLFYDTPDMLSKIQRTGNAIKLIAGTLFETDRLPPGWRAPLLSADEIWVPTDFNMKSFAEGTGKTDNLRKVPLCIDIRPYSAGIKPMKIKEKKAFAFLYSFACPSRKDPQLLLKSYFRAFTAKDDVCLVLKTMLGRIRLDELFASLQPDYDVPRDHSLPPVIHIEENLSHKGMISLFKACDVYVSSERAKGWDYPAMEMMALGKPCVSINWSGSTEFMNADNSFLVNHTGKYLDIDFPDVVPAAYPLYKEHHWPEVEIEAFACQMREAYENTKKRNQLGVAAKEHIYSKYSHIAVGQTIRHIFENYKFPATMKRSNLTLPRKTTKTSNQNEADFPLKRKSAKPDFTPQEKTAVLLEHLIIDRLASIAKKHKRVAIFPCGAHTKWLLLIMKKARRKKLLTPTLVCLMDDNPSNMEIFKKENIPLFLPEDCPIDMIDAILISSDSAEAKLASHIRKSLRASKPVLKLYRELQKWAPFEKGKHV